MARGSKENLPHGGKDETFDPDPLRTIWCTYLHLSDRAWEIFSSAWTLGTYHSYTTPARKWLTYAHSQGISVTEPTTNQCVDFLVGLLDSGAGSSTVNTTRSLMSNFITLDGRPMGEHPLLRKIVKGVKVQRPPIEPYSHVWDPAPVIISMAAWGNLPELDLDKLTRRTITLFILATGQRPQAIHQLLRKDIQKVGESVRIKYSNKLKSNDPRKNPLILRFDRNEDTNTCVYSHLMAYMDHPLLQSTVSQLFRATNTPNKGISSTTVSKYIRQTLVDTGIDMHFAAYSTRHSATSAAARAHIPIHEIMESAGWRRESTFAKYYNRPLLPELPPPPQTNFIPALLGGYNVNP